MAISLYTQAFGISNAKSQVVITEVSTGIPATILSSATGGVVSVSGITTLDSNGNLSVYIDTARTWVVTLVSQNQINNTLITTPLYLPNWSSGGVDGVSITATSSSGVTQIASTSSQINSTSIMVDNPGPYDVYIKTGGTNIIAATNLSLRVPAGSMQPFTKGAGSSYIAVISPSGNQPIVVFVGEGQ